MVEQGLQTEVTLLVFFYFGVIVLSTLFLYTKPTERLSLCQSSSLPKVTYYISLTGVTKTSQDVTLGAQKAKLSNPCDFEWETNLISSERDVEKQIHRQDKLSQDVP